MVIKELKPTNDRVALIRDEAERQSPGGILLPSNKERPQTGKVLAIGPGTDKVTITAKPGDTVLFAMYAGHEIEVAGQEITILRWDDILAILN